MPPVQPPAPPYQPHQAYQPYQPYQPYDPVPAGMGAGAAATATATYPVVTTEPPPVKPPKERSVLGRITLSVLLLVLGITAALDAAGAVDPQARHYLALAIGVLGLGLVVGAWRGRARGLVWLGIPLTVALIAVSTAEVNLDGGAGDRQYRPLSVGEVQDRYEVGVGNLELDLSELDFTGRVVSTTASAGIGHVAGARAARGGRRGGRPGRHRRGGPVRGAGRRAPRRSGPSSTTGRTARAAAGSSWSSRSAWEGWRWTVRRHEVDVLSLVFGLFFVGAALIWGLADDPGVGAARLAAAGAAHRGRRWPGC